MNKEMRKEKAGREAIIAILKPSLPFDNDKSIIRAYKNLVGKFPEIVTYPIFFNITKQYKNEKQIADAILNKKPRQKADQPSERQTSKEKPDKQYKQRSKKKKLSDHHKKREYKSSFPDFCEGWTIAKAIDGEYRCIIFLHNPHITIKDPEKHKERIISGDFGYICELIQESPQNLYDPILFSWLPILENYLIQEARYGDLGAREKLAMLCKAKIGKKRSLKEVKRNIKMVKYILDEKEKTKKSIDNIISECDQWEKIQPDRMWQIYKEHKKVIDTVSPVLGSLDNVFNFLDICGSNLQKRFCYIEYEDFLFVKSDGAIMKGGTVEFQKF